MNVPTYEDAQLVLKLYELRREEKLRAAREWFTGKFFPASVADVEAVAAKPGTENVYFRMATSYWEMAASFIVRGVLNADLFLDSGGEMLMVWVKLEKFLPEIRGKSVGPTFLSNIERVVETSAAARERLPIFRRRMAQIRERMLAAAKA